MKSNPDDYFGAPSGPSASGPPSGRGDPTSLSGDEWDNRVRVNKRRGKRKVGRQYTETDDPYAKRVGGYVVDFDEFDEPTIREYIAQFWRSDREFIERMQRRLIAAGKLEEKDLEVGYGTPDDATSNALENALAQTWMQGTDLDTYLDSRAKDFAGKLGQGKDKPGFEYADQAQIEELIDGIYEEAAGRKATLKERRALVAKYRGREKTGLTRSRQASEGTNVTGVTPAAHVESDIGQQSGAEVSAWQATKLFRDGILKAIREG